jgi:hypothetical protein
MVVNVESTGTGYILHPRYVIMRADFEDLNIEVDDGWRYYYQVQADEVYPETNLMFIDIWSVDDEYFRVVRLKADVDNVEVWAEQVGEILRADPLSPYSR